jgi:hypothetical protein
MPRQNTHFLAFNRGLISSLGLARVDLKRTALSAEVMTNWMPRTLGSMMLRPGLQYLGTTRSNAKAVYLQFIKATDDKALVELTASSMRVWVDDEVITRPSVSTAVTNGGFDADVASWTDSDEVGGTSAWVTGGYMGLTGNGTAAAIRDQTLTVAAADQSVEHALRVVIKRGPVTLRVGSTSGGDEYINETELETGTHSLAFTPTGANVYVRFLSRLKRQVLVDSVSIESAGAMAVTSPWGLDDLENVRFDQSGDVLFVACAGYQQRRIERRASRSWSIARYVAEDGPFRTENVGSTTLTASAISGNITLTASAALFRSTHVGAIFRHTSEGQQVSASITAEDTWSNSIRVTGVGDARSFSVQITGTWSATVTVQRSIGEEGDWQDVPTLSHTTNQLYGYADALDNQIVYYRIGVKTGDFTSGTVEAQLDYAFGSITGVVRVTAYSSATSVSAEVLTDLGGTDATEVWAEGAWSDYRGWPTAVAFDQGRLWWTGKNGIFASISDAFASHDPDYEGDAGPINRTIGSGPVDVINWLLPLQRLVVGAQGAEHSIKSTSFDEPITPTNFQIKGSTTQGSAARAAVKVDSRGVFIQRGGARVMELAFNPEIYDYAATDLTALVPDIAKGNRFLGIAVQRQPDTRLHCWRQDGTVAMAIFDRTENVLCWFEVETDGVVEHVAVLPGDEGDEEDHVYYAVRRTINGSDVRYLERWAFESQCEGGALNRQADSFIVYSGAMTKTIGGLSHLEGEEVVVWGQGEDIGTYTVSGGQITGLAEYVTDAIVGLGYTAQWKNAKFAMAAALGLSLLQPKKVAQLGVILANTHHHGLQYGPSFDALSDLPDVEAGAEVADDTVHTTYDEMAFEFDGEWTTDARICLQAQAPRPCTLLAQVATVETHDKY